METKQKQYRNQFSVNYSPLKSAKSLRNSKDKKIKSNSLVQYRLLNQAKSTCSDSHLLPVRYGAGIAISVAR
jgi:hypothetical protein